MIVDKRLRLHTSTICVRQGRVRCAGLIGRKRPGGAEATAPACHPKMTGRGWADENLGLRGFEVHPVFVGQAFRPLSVTAVTCLTLFGAGLTTAA
jgi:hypothetical protein